MPDGSIPYAHLVENALMDVVRQVLRDAAATGLEAPHHFYITFRTDHPGVDIPPDLQQRYRQEMTIVLQYQFWDLVVDDDRFAVTLSFGGRPHALSIPFAAIKVFADPGVEFGLQFTLADAAADDAPTDDADEIAPAGPNDADDEALPPVGEEPGATPPKGADIVTLDRFRKR